MALVLFPLLQGHNTQPLMELLQSQKTDFHSNFLWLGRFLTSKLFKLLYFDHSSSSRMALMLWYFCTDLSVWRIIVHFFSNFLVLFLHLHISIEKSKVFTHIWEQGYWLLSKIYFIVRNVYTNTTKTLSLSLLVSFSTFKDITLNLWLQTKTLFQVRLILISGLSLLMPVST